MCEFDDTSAEIMDIEGSDEADDITDEMEDISDELRDSDDVTEPLTDEEVGKILDEMENSEPLPELVDATRELKSVVHENVQRLNKPASHGVWTGDPGNSEWVMDDDYVPKSNNPGRLTIGAIKEKYDFNSIRYNGNEPDFSSFCAKKYGEVKLDEFPDERLGKGGTYELAMQKAVEVSGDSREEIEKYIKDNNLTWHECADRKTVQLVPTILNSTFSHTGGIGMEKSINALGKYIDDNHGSLTMKRESLGAGQNVDFNMDAFHKELKGKLREYKKYESKNG